MRKETKSVEVTASENAIESSVDEREGVAIANDGKETTNNSDGRKTRHIDDDTRTAITDSGEASSSNRSDGRMSNDRGDARTSSTSMASGNTFETIRR